MNTHVRDDLLETAAAKAAAAGDLFYATGANALAVLSLGTKGRHYIVNDGETAPVLAPGIDIMDRDLSQVDVVNDASETSIYSFAIPAGTLGATGGVRLTIGGDMLVNTAGTLVLRVKLGSTTILGSPSMDLVNTSNLYKWTLQIWLLNSAADAQKAHAVFDAIAIAGTFPGVLGDSDLAVHLTGYGTAAEDTGSEKILDVTADWSAAQTSLSFRKEMALLERIAA